MVSRFWGWEQLVTKLSIVVPVHNEAPRVARCLEALLGQTALTGRNPHCTTEVIVVDDGSTDDTATIVARYPVRLIRQPHRGSAVARNCGAAAAAGEFLLFTDADCRPRSDWAERMIEPFAEARVAGTKGLFRSDQRQLIARLVQAEYEEKEDRMLRQRRIAFADTASAAFRATVFRELGGFRTDLGAVEDTEFSFRLTAMGHWLMLAPQAVVYHEHPTTLLEYARRKFRYGRWGAWVYLSYPHRVMDDSRTPWSMRLQLVLVPLSLVLSIPLAMAPFLDGLPDRLFLAWLGTIALYTASTVPFAWRVRRDPAVALAAWPFFAVRALAVSLGILSGLIAGRPRRRPDDAA